MAAFEWQQRRFFWHSHHSRVAYSNVHPQTNRPIRTYGLWRPLSWRWQWICCSCYGQGRLLVRLRRACSSACLVQFTHNRSFAKGMQGGKVGFCSRRKESRQHSWQHWKISGWGRCRQSSKTTPEAASNIVTATFRAAVSLARMSRQRIMIQQVSMILLLCRFEGQLCVAPAGLHLWFGLQLLLLSTKRNSEAVAAEKQSYFLFSYLLISKFSGQAYLKLFPVKGIYKLSRLCDIKPDWVLCYDIFLEYILLGISNSKK